MFICQENQQTTINNHDGIFVDPGVNLSLPVNQTLLTARKKVHKFPKIRERIRCNSPAVRWSKLNMCHRVIFGPWQQHSSRTGTISCPSVFRLQIRTNTPRNVLPRSSVYQKLLSVCQSPVLPLWPTDWTFTSADYNHLTAAVLFVYIVIWHQKKKNNSSYSWLCNNFPMSMRSGLVWLSDTKEFTFLSLNCFLMTSVIYYYIFPPN